MQNDNYVIDDARGMGWNSPSDAATWYEQRLTEAQNALRELMVVMPELVRLLNRQGVDLSEQDWLDRAQTYIDIYEGRQNATAE